MWLFSFLSWNIRGQWLIWDKVNVFIRHFCFSSPMEFVILERACSFWLASLDSVVAWLSNKNCVSSLLQGSFSLVLLWITRSSLFVWTRFCDVAMGWHLSGLNFRRFFLNHSKNFVQQISNSVFTTSLIGMLRSKTNKQKTQENN